MHGAGSPQAQKVVVQRMTNWAEKVRLAQRVAGVTRDT
jgi:4-hydroxybutyryl-CoA dehydratase/vinylacetyl-CoA-Delta-isomerase